MAKSKKAQVEIVPAAELAKIRKGNTLIVGDATTHIVCSANSENIAYTVLKRIADAKKTIEKRRKEITQPLNASLRSANALFKEVVAPLVEADGILRGKILAFQRIQQAKADKEQERREKIQAAHEAKGHETHTLEEVEPDVGVSTVTKRWAIRITDATKLPEKVLRQLMRTDEGYEVMGKWLRKQMREADKEADGRPILDIPGTEVFQDTRLRV